MTDAVAALLLAADLLVVAGSVLSRRCSIAPVEWADDVARGLMVALSFFGAAGALARGDNVGVAFFVDACRPARAESCDATGALLGAGDRRPTSPSTRSSSGSSPPARPPAPACRCELTFYPMGVGALCMALFALDAVPAAAMRANRHRARGRASAVVAGIWLAWSALSPGQHAGPGPLMLPVSSSAWSAACRSASRWRSSALIFMWVEGTLPGVIFAQQMARGIDNFVLLAIPFFILVGYLMEANGMSVRLIELLERLVGRMRGGLNVVMVLAMVIFSGISGSKMADVAAVGSVLIPAARRSRQNPGGAVALLAASAVMAETIPPCINLIILGFVANLSIGGLFMAGLLPAGLMALALIAVGGAVRQRRGARRAMRRRAGTPLAKLWGGAAVTLGLIAIIFGGFRSGFATATEISAFAALYALVVGGVVFRELGPRAALRSFVNAATRSGLVLFIVAAAQALAFVLTLQQVPHALAEVMIALSHDSGAWAVHAAVDRHPDRDGFGAGGRGGADHLRPAAGAGGGAARHRAAALRRGAGDRHGDRAVRAAARAGAVWRVPDRRRADRGDRQADARLSGAAAGVPAGDRVRARRSRCGCRTRRGIDRAEAEAVGLGRKPAGRLKSSCCNAPEITQRYARSAALPGMAIRKGVV